MTAFYNKYKKYFRKKAEKENRQHTFFITHNFVCNIVYNINHFLKFSIFHNIEPTKTLDIFDILTELK